MHWFWRAIVAVILSGIPSMALVLWYPNGPPQLFWLRSVFCICMLLALPGSVLGIAAYAMLTYQARKSDSETHCRKCQYILKGITEPRCPECGERI